MRSFYRPINFALQVSKRIGANIEFTYLIAGGDLALLKSQEKAEDDVLGSIDDLKNSISESTLTHVVYIGITCGLSAPYVGSQIQWILDNEKESHLRFTTILLGFNPIDVARKTLIEKYDRSMFDIVKALESKLDTTSHFILNPAVGPESITGSTRMKGGSATKILIEAIFVKLFQDAFNCSLLKQPLKLSMTEILNEYERAYRFTYLNIDKVATVIEKGGLSLKNGKRIIYISQDTIGILGVIDASECPPTYGANFNDVRGFNIGGWASLSNISGDMSSHGDYYCLSETYFIDQVLPDVTRADTVIFLLSEDMNFSSLTEVYKTCKEKGLSIIVIYWCNDEKLECPIEAMSSEDVFVPISIPQHSFFEDAQCLVEFSAKLVLNAISTGAHIIKGKVWKNKMIDLSLSNNKLFYRGIGLVSSITNVSEAESQTCILKAIYQTDDISNDIQKAPVSDHIERAMKVKKLIPTAILLASKQCKTVQESIEALNKEPILRNLISQMVNI